MAGKILGSVPIGGFIGPLDEDNLYPVTDPVWGLGSLRSVADIAERNAITDRRREEGMLVYIKDEDVYYRLNAPLTNND